MEYILEFFQSYGSQISIIGSALAFLFGTYKYFKERRENHYWKEFEIFHKLVRELVEPPAKGLDLYIDRQAAIVFELRNFKRYYPYSLRMLIGLRSTWNSEPEKFPRLMEELNLTILFLESKVKRSYISNRLCSLFK